MQDIQTLFQTDPLKLTKEELREVCIYYREKFAAFQLGDMKAGATKKAKAGNGKKLTAEEVDALLNDM